jgi:hypothetical protein
MLALRHWSDTFLQVRAKKRPRKVIDFAVAPMSKGYCEAVAKCAVWYGIGFSIEFWMQRGIFRG